METNTPDNDLPHDWDLDMQYEDRYADLGDAETMYDEDWGDRYGFDPGW